jgi:hypothetical protein
VLPYPRGRVADRREHGDQREHRREPVARREPAQERRVRERQRRRAERAPTKWKIATGGTPRATRAPA